MRIKNKNSIVNRARCLQERIEKWYVNLPELTASTYFFVLMVLFFATGMTLFVYMLLSNTILIGGTEGFVAGPGSGINFNNVNPLTDPILFLGLGTVCGICYFCFKFGSKQKKNLISKSSGEV